MLQGMLKYVTNYDREKLQLLGERHYFLWSWFEEFGIHTHLNRPEKHLREDLYKFCIVSLCSSFFLLIFYTCIKYQ